MMHTIQNGPIGFGFQGEWKHFHEQYPLFLDRSPNLKDALELAFSWTSEAAKPIEKFVQLYGRLCVEDFFEVLLCCGNGYGIAAEKLLRSLYEHAVTLEYLRKHPEDLDNFLDFHYISQYKFLNEIRNFPGSEKYFTDAKVAEVTKQRDSVIEKFMISDCEKCGTRRLNHNWSKLDFVSMAKKTELGKLLVFRYYEPLQHAHSTNNALLRRLEETQAGTITFNPTAQRKDAERALMTAHNIVLCVLRIEDKQFTMAGLTTKIDTCYQDFRDIWNTKKPDAAKSTRD